MSKRISSSITLLLRLFVPVFWLVFFGAFSIAILFFSQENMPQFQTLGFRIGVIVFYLIGALFLYFTFLKLKRVEADNDFVYVTNYFKNYRYPYHNIEKISVTNLILFQLTTIRLKEKGSFGKKIRFLQSKIKFVQAATEFPALRELLDKSQID
ncbi:hypothetical protein [Membranihabitans marinus]|uniref:hypothetical protein n=1 Tax=Membranihabitans marinus TaxID=1227546 RepID=UPI001F324730|nr:hypothetical protein [Membranihabitans marinus]